MNNREAMEQIEGMRFQVQSSLDEVEVDVDSKEAEEDNRKLVEAFDMAIKALEQTEWIPVKSKDDYPKTHEEVFVTYNDGKVGINSVFTGYAKGDYIKTWNRGGNVIAWKPLPEPYKGDTE